MRSPALDGSVTVAAMDAGSNALRLLVARAGPSGGISPIANQRHAVRLGHRAFTRRSFDDEIIDRTVKVFRKFRKSMDRHGVASCRAVATSAAREARNREVLQDAVLREAGIDLEVITPREEARLVRMAVLDSLKGRDPPCLIADLGGGSLEVTRIDPDEGEVLRTLPLGTVRLMERFELNAPLTRKRLRTVADHVDGRMEAAFPGVTGSPAGPAVACGGNAEALARLAGTNRPGKHPVLEVGRLGDLHREIESLTIRERMAAFGVRRDRAEVMGIAALVILRMSRRFGLRRLVVPGVGVKEGVLLQLLLRHGGIGTAADPEERRRALLRTVRRFGKGLGYGEDHAARVRALATGFFDDLRPLHGLSRDLRLTLEIAAEMHDIGKSIESRDHHRHGEYIVRHADLPGLGATRRSMVACLVRYHNRHDPTPEHGVYGSLDAERRRQVQVLLSLLRIADALTARVGGPVRSVATRVNGSKVEFRIRAPRAAPTLLKIAERRSRLFEREFKRRAVFRMDSR